LVTWPKKALFRHFFIFFQLRSSAMRLQKGKKLTKNSSFLTQAPNRKQALSKFIFQASLFSGFY
jgi:hypothetical protein